MVLLLLPSDYYYYIIIITMIIIINIIQSITTMRISTSVSILHLRLSSWVTVIVNMLPRLLLPSHFEYVDTFSKMCSISFSYV